MLGLRRYTKESWIYGLEETTFRNWIYWLLF